MLLRRECCSFSNGEYLKAGLHELELWCIKVTDQVTLNHFRTLWLSQTMQKFKTHFLHIFFCTLVYFAVCWLILGWTQTHTPKCGISGILSLIMIEDNDALFLSLFLTKLLNCFANAGFASKDSKIFGGDHKWTMPGNVTNSNLKVFYWEWT